MEAILAWLGGAKLFIASVIGGFLSMNFFEKKRNADGTVIPMSYAEKWTSFIGGTALGIFCAPAAVALADISPKIAPQVETLAGIVIAMFGMSSASQIVRIIGNITWQDIKDKIPWGAK